MSAIFQGDMLLLQPRIVPFLDGVVPEISLPESGVFMFGGRDARFTGQFDTVHQAPSPQIEQRRLPSTEIMDNPGAVSDPPDEVRSDQ